MIGTLWRRLLRLIFKQHVLKLTSTVVIDELSSQYLMNPTGMDQAAIRDVKVDLFEGMLRDGHIQLKEMKGRRERVLEATCFVFKV